MSALAPIYAHPTAPQRRSRVAAPKPALLNLPYSRRDLRILILLFLVAILSATDLVFTLFANKLGILNEMNPIAASYLNAGLEPSLICYKILMVLAGSTMLWRVRYSKWALPAAWSMLLAHVALAVIWYLWACEVISTFNAILNTHPKL